MDSAETMVEPVRRNLPDEQQAPLGVAMRESGTGISSSGSGGQGSDSGVR